jgi:hypothetical protein
LRASLRPGRLLAVDRLQSEAQLSGCGLLRAPEVPTATPHRDANTMHVRARHRTVRIQDRRLGIPYYFFLAAILVYNGFLIFVEVGR